MHQLLLISDANSQIVVLLLLHGELLIKKTIQTLIFLETSKIGNDSLVFDMYYLLSKRCFDLCIIYCSTVSTGILTLVRYAIIEG